MLAQAEMRNLFAVRARHRPFLPILKMGSGLGETK
jgi:hypothetical protein